MVTAHMGGGQVDRGDSGKMIGGIQSLMQSVVTIALSVRADDLSSPSSQLQEQVCCTTSSVFAQAPTFRELVGFRLIAVCVRSCSPKRQATLAGAQPAVAAARATAVGRPTRP